MIDNNGWADKPGVVRVDGPVLTPAEVEARIATALDKAAEEILKNLKDRRGIRQVIEQCDADVQAEIGRTVAANAITKFLYAVNSSKWPRAIWLADAVLAAAKDQTND